MFNFNRPILRHGARAVRLTLMIAGAFLAVAFVTTLTIDLGPRLRERAEAAGSSYLNRPMHIGGLHFRLYSGTFIVEDLVIEGLEPADRPFLRAGRIEVRLSWPSLLRRDVLLQSVEMTDWQMLTEQFGDGRHNFPQFIRSSGENGQRPFTVTLGYVRAYRGQFTYEDHGAPWSAVARNLDVTVTKGLEYRGTADFHGGTVTIGDHVPMWANMRVVFRLDGSVVHVERLDLDTDGAVSHVTGTLDFARFPEQTWDVESRVQFQRMREIFFRNEDWVLSGEGDFTGTFRIPWHGPRELKGQFTSAALGVYDYRFSSLRGRLEWVPDRFEVTGGSASLYGGRAAYTFSMAPLGSPTPGTARFEVRYEHVDLAAFTDARELPGLRLAGLASGRNRLEWPLGRFADHAGEGRITVEPPAGAVMFAGDLRGPLAADAGRADPDFDRPLGTVPFAAGLTYRYDPEWVELESGHFSTARTTVQFGGRTAYGEQSNIPFAVTSGDWQESDRLLAGMMTAFGVLTSPEAFGGRGHFDGVMLGSFRSPRIEGTFTGERLRAFDVVWGRGTAEIAVENRYLDISRSVIEQDGSRIEADGRFSLGFPRRDGGEEWNARILVTDSPIRDLRHAFDIDDYDIDGRLSGEFHLFGSYRAPFGFGSMTIRDGLAYGEAFERGTAGLRFEGQGIRLDGIEMAHAGGTLTGAAFIGWDGTYSFNADGGRLPLENLSLTRRSGLPLTGLVRFTTRGSGRFDEPRFEVEASIDGLFLGDEGIGQVTGRLMRRGTMLTLEVDAASPRLAVTGTGRITLDAAYDAELMFRFSDTSLDPYLRPYLPRLSPFTTAIGTGTLRVEGALADRRQLLVATTLDELRLRLFDYALTNDAPIRMALDDNVVELSPTRLVGQDTELELAGSVDLNRGQVDGEASGRANLGVLQGFFRDIRSSGRAELAAQIHGPMDTPVFSGSASITDGRLRHFSLPRSLDSVNGRVLFDARGVRVDDLTATVGGGAVRFGGRVNFDGYVPSEVSLTATGQNMQLRYPAEVRSNVDADLALTGRVASPTLSGTVTVKSAVWTGNLESSPTFLNLTQALSGSPTPAPASPPERALPVQFDVRLVVPDTFEVNTEIVQATLSTDVTLRGTYDRPLLFGQGEIDRGIVNFEGRRYVITRGRLDFTNPTRIDPFFDVEAETSVRQPGQTYRVSLRATGTRSSVSLEFSSDPPLPEVDVIAMLFGDVRTSQDAELQALQRPELIEQELLKARAARLLGSPIFSEVGRVVEQTFGVDTFQITPLVDEDSLQQSSRFNPGARLTIGKQVSDRVYLTYARSLNTPTRDQIILIEFDQSDRFSWIFTRNEDETYSLDIRVRHEF